MEGEGDLVDPDQEIDEENEPIYETAGKSTTNEEINENAGRQTTKSSNNSIPKNAGNEKNATEISSKCKSNEGDIQNSSVVDVKVMNNESSTPCETQASKHNSNVVTPPCFINSTLQKERIDTSAEIESSFGCLDGSPALKTSSGTGKDNVPPIKRLGDEYESCKPSLSQHFPSQEIEQLPPKDIPPVDHPLTTPLCSDQSTSLKQPPKRAVSPHASANSPNAPATIPHSPTMLQAKVSSEVSTTKTDNTSKKDQFLKSAGFVDNQNITGFNNNNENEVVSDKTNFITVPDSDVFIPKNDIEIDNVHVNVVNTIPNDATSIADFKSTANNQKDVYSTLNTEV